MAVPLAKAGKELAFGGQDNKSSIFYVFCSVIQISNHTFFVFLRRIAILFLHDDANI